MSSLSRVLEPEVMDTEEDAREYDLMDHAEVNRAFAARALALLQQGGSPLRVLDVGTGTALIPIALCQLDPRVEIVAVDLAEEMLKRARVRVREAGLDGRIRLERVDAKGLPYPDGHFDLVMSNTIVHHIPEPGRMLREVARLVRPGGALLVRDLERPVDDSAVLALVERYAHDGTPPQRALYEASLRAALTLGEARALVADLAPGADVVRSSDRHWTWERPLAESIQH